MTTERPEFLLVCKQLSLPDPKLLQWSEVDKDVHPEAAKLGADLLSAQELYKDLQNKMGGNESNSSDIVPLKANECYDMMATDIPVGINECYDTRMKANDTVSTIPVRINECYNTTSISAPEGADQYIEIVQ